jgi:type II secretory pathway component GspD/PulD (secretin)
VKYRGIFKEDILINASAKGLIWCLVIGIVLWFAPATFGQQASENVSMPAHLKDGLMKTVTLDADDAFLPSILSILADKSGFNIVTGPGVNTQERISVHLKDTPIEEAINLVVRAAGLSYEIVGNSILVADADALSQEIGLSAHVIDLKFAQANEIKELLKDLTTKVEVDTSGNRLLVLASPKVISEVNNIIKAIDVAPPQIMLEARLIEVATDDLDKVGIDWEKLSNFTTILAESPMVRDLSSGETDGSSRPPNETDFGGNLPDLGQLPEKYSFEKIEGFDNTFKFSRQLYAFDIALDFLMKRNKAKVLAHTQLTTLNNRAATILIGETLRWAVTSRENAIVVTDSVGIKLQITPTINSDGYITTRVTPEVSSITELVLGIYPRKKIRTASTTVLVKDGQQIFIGGLFSVQDSKIEYKMPLFANIPLIGKLFTHTYNSTQKTDLLIEITPRIVREGVSYTDASNLTSDGVRILDEGQTTDLRALMPEVDSLSTLKSGIKNLKDDQREMSVPHEQRKQQ